jgi:hypothetical protein
MQMDEDFDMFNPDIEKVNQLIIKISKLFEGQELNNIIPALTNLLGTAIGQRTGNIVTGTQLYLLVIGNLLSYLNQTVEKIEKQASH